MTVWAQLEFYCTGRGEERIVVVWSPSHVWLFATPWTVAHQAPLSMGFFKQEYWSGLLFPSPGVLPNPGIKPTSAALAGGFFTIQPPVNNGYWGIISYICDSEQLEIEKGRKNTPKERKSFVPSHHHHWALRSMLPHFPDNAWEWGWGCKRDFWGYFDHAQVLRDRSGLWLD